MRLNALRGALSLLVKEGRITVVDSISLPEIKTKSLISVLDTLQTLSLCTNLGDTKTLLTHPASTSHGKLSEAQRQAAGIGQGLIRVAVGLEHPQDVQDDLARGLNTLP